MIERQYLIDVSRLVWRCWTGRLPTGIDRVCLAYLEQFGARAQAVIRRGRWHLVCSPVASDHLIALILEGGPDFRRKLLRLLPLIAVSSWAHGRNRRQGAIYFNIGHTGLDEPLLPLWIARNKLRAVFLIHDLIPLTHPEFCRAGEAERHRSRIRNVLSCAAGIIGNSQSTLDDVAAFAAEEGLAVPPFVAAWISGTIIPETAPPSQLDRPYFIVVGTIEGRKNHVLLFQIWRKLVESMGPAAPRLVVIGQRGWEAEHAEAMLERNALIRGHVREIGDASDGEVARLIAGARALLMPSFAEGFGLPVVEALQLGTPVICSDLPAFREIAGDIPTYLDPIDGEGWRRMLLDYLGDCPERERQLRAMEGYDAPDWPSHFAVVEPWLETL